MPELTIHLNAPHIVRLIEAKEPSLASKLSAKLSTAKRTVVDAVSQFQWAHAKAIVRDVGPALVYPITQPTKLIGNKLYSLYSPAQAPAPVIARIHASAEAGLKEATAMGFTVQAPPVETQAKRTDLTRNWHAQINEKTTDISKKLSAFTSLMQMRERAGIQPIKKADADRLALLNLAKQAVETPNASLWKLFVERYRPSIWQKVKAAVFHFFCSGIIAKTIDTYLKGFIDQVKTKLTTEHDATRNAVFRELVQNLDKFCTGDEAATRTFSEGKENKTLEELRNYNIEERYNFDLPKLCALLSESLAAASSVQVPLISSTLKNLPLMGRLFNLIEWFINRYILHKVVKSILPTILQDSISEGISLSTPSNIAFGLAISTFLRGQLQEFNKLLEQDLLRGSPAEGKGVKLIHGMETFLPNTIKKFKRILELESIKDANKLGQKIEDLKNKADNETIDQKLEEGITDGVNSLFEYLNDAAKSGELFNDLLKLCDTLFTNDNQDLATLQRRLEEEKETIDRQAKSLVKKLLYSKLPQAIDDKVTGWLPKWVKGTPKTVRISTNTLFNENKIKLTKALNAAEKECQQLTTLTNLPVTLATSRGIHTHLISLFEVMKSFSMKEIENKIEHLSTLDQDSLWYTLTPLYQKAEQLLKKQALELQSLQKKHTDCSEIETHLQQIHTIWTGLQPTGTPPNLWLKTLTESFEKILPLIAVNEKGEFDAKAKALAALYAQWTNATKQLTLTNDLESKLQMLYDYENNRHPWGFKFNQCLSDIQQLITSSALNDSERNALKTLIGNGYPIQANKTQLDTQLQQIRARHTAAFALCRTTANAVLTDNSLSWAQTSSQKCILCKQDIHQEMQLLARTLEEGIHSLRLKAENLSSPISKPLTPLAEKTTALATSAAIYSGFAYTGAGPLGAVLSTLGSAYSHVVWQGEKAPTVPTEEPIDPENKNLTKQQLQEKEKEKVNSQYWSGVASMTGSALAAPVAAYVYPSTLLTSGASALFGGALKKRLYSWYEDTQVIPKAKKIFDGIKDLFLEKDQRVYKWLYTSTIQSADKAFRFLAKEQTAK